MSLLGYLTDAISLQPLGTADAEQARSDAADAELRQLNDLAVSSGYYTPAQRDAANVAITAGNATTGASNYTGSVWSAFVEGLKTGPGQTSKSFWDWLSELLGGVLKAIPWWVWTLLGVAVFWYFGGFEWVRKKIKSKI